MDAIFVELRIFETKRADYLSDDEFKAFQQMLLKNPFCGDVIQHTGGLRKVRFADLRHNEREMLRKMLEILKLGGTL